MNKYFLLFISIFSFFILFPARSLAVNFFVAPPVVAVGQETTILLGINTEGQNINTIELNIKFPNNDFIVKDINYGNSIVNFWIEKPIFLNEKGEINLSGVIVDGYSGNDGELLKIDLIAKQQGDKEFFVQNAKILLNDGNGTEAKMTVDTLKLDVVNSIESSKKPEVVEDKDIPESFLPQVAQESNTFSGKYFLVFASQDKNSGIDHYEVKEERAFKMFGLKLGFAEWVKAESPYVLKDQELKSYIFVKAVDQSGNSRIETISPVNPSRWYENYFIWIIMILVLIVIGCVFWRKEKRKINANENKK